MDTTRNLGTVSVPVRADRGRLPNGPVLNTAICHIYITFFVTLLGYYNRLGFFASMFRIYEHIVFNGNKRLTTVTKDCPSFRLENS